MDKKLLEAFTGYLSIAKAFTGYLSLAKKHAQFTNHNNMK